MPNFTRKAIKDSFWKLLNQKPLNQITVKDIVLDCGINRNSFYYHFQDMPSLLEEIIEEIISTTIKEHPTVDTLEDGINVVVNFVLENKKAVYHIYNSIDHAIMEKYLLDIADYAVRKYMDTVSEELPVDEADKETIINYHKSECIGQVVLWLNSGMKDDIKEQIHDFCDMSIGLTEYMIKKSQNKKKQ